MNRKKYDEKPYALSLDWLSFYMTVLPNSPLLINPPFEYLSIDNVALRFVQSQERTHSTRYRAWNNWRSLYEVYVEDYNIGVLGIDHLLVSQLSGQCLMKINNEYFYQSPERIIGYVNRLYEVLCLRWNGIERMDIALYSHNSFVQWYLRNVRYSSVNKVWIVGKPITNILTAPRKGYEAIMLHMAIHPLLLAHRIKANILKDIINPAIWNPIKSSG